jgi:drug/metabolite transporter (DMT)-like permease
VQSFAAVRGFGYLLVVVTALSFSTNGPVSRLALDTGLEPRDLAALRMFGSALLLGVAAVGAIRHLRRSEALRTTAFGTVISLALVCYSEAVLRIDVAVALVIVYLNPLVVAIWQRVFHGERLPAAARAAMALAIGGVAAMVFGASGGVGQISTVGLVLSIATMFCASAQVLIAPTLPPGLSPLQRTGAGLLAGALVFLVADPVWTIPWDALADPASLGNLGGEAPVGALVLWVTVVGTAIPYLTLVAGTVRIGAGAASVVTMIEPVAAAILAWLILGQSLTAVQILGAAVALGGILLVELARSRYVVLAPAGGG